MNKLEELFKKDQKILIGYMPAGFPDLQTSKEIIKAMVDGGVDAIEVGFPYSDPVMDGPTIQAAAELSLKNGTSASDVFDVLSFASTLAPSVIMSYWNPIEKYGTERFVKDMVSAGGSGTITPDLTIEEATTWLQLSHGNELSTIFVVAPSSTDERLKSVVTKCQGFVYAASLMGVTGARDVMSNMANNLVDRLRQLTSLPIAVGLGVSTPHQASNVAKFADGVIVGSAFINEFNLGGLSAVKSLAQELKGAI